MTQVYTVARHPGRAKYLYAGQAGTGGAPLKPASFYRAGKLPTWLAGTSELDFLDPANPFFYTDRALFSFGPFIGDAVPPTMFGKRPGAVILGDSGGYQFIGKPEAFRSDETRHWVLTTLEHETDEAMTLDIPTAAIRPEGPWRNLDAALAISVESLRFFDRHRAGNTRFLNVLQGRTSREAITWYEAVRWFPAGGWAFGGAMRRNWAHLVLMLRRLEADGLLGADRNRVHVLGVGDLKGAVLLSAIQRGMQERLGDDQFLITFDASSPSYIAGMRAAYGLPRFNDRDWTIDMWSPPTTNREGRAAAPWPFQQTAIGRNLTWADLCVTKSGVARTAWDGLSEALVVHHNVNALLWAIDAANAIMELHPDDARGLSPAGMIRGYQALRSACLARDPVSYLRPYAPELVGLAGEEEL